MRRWFPYFALLVALVAFCKLGFWQLDRYDEKLVAVAGVEAAKSAEPVLLADGLPDDSQKITYLRVRLTGQWHPQKSFLWDNRVRKQRVGYQLVTPFELENGEFLLVDRGWLPGNPDRVILPAFETPTGTQQLTGLLRRLPEAAMRLEEQLETGWPRRVQTLDAAKLSAAFGERLPNLLLWLDHDAANNQQAGIYPALQHSVSMAPEKHLGYAVQWFALAATAVILIGIIALRRRRRAQNS